MVDGDGSELLGLLVRHSPVPQFVARADGSLVIANQSYATLVGATLDEVVGTRPAEVVHPADLPALLALGEQLLNREIEVFELETRVQRADGTYRSCVATCTLALDADGRRLVICHLLDVTHRKEAEARLELSQSRFRLLADSLPVGIHHRDPDGRLLYVNQQWTEITGVSAEEAVGTDYIDLVHPDDREQVLQMRARLAEGTAAHHKQFRIRRPDGEVRWVSSRAVALPGDDGQPAAWVGSFEDITGVLEALEARHQLEAELAHRATHDALTGLPNRALLLDHLETAVGQPLGGSEAVAVLFIDLDGFKSVNDQLGHDAGDQLLQVVAQRLTAALRPSDVVGRLGGDEFVVLCPAVTGADQAREVANRLLAAVSTQPIMIDGRAIEVTASIGLTVSAGGDGHHPEGLLREADAAMYRAKALGRARYELFVGPAATRPAAARLNRPR